MKIKTKKKMRLDELIKHIYDNDVKKRRIFIDDGENFAVHTTFLNAAVNIECLKGCGGKKCISKSDTFTVEVEEIVTPTTIFDELTEYIYDSNDDHHFTAEHKGANISMIRDCETHQFKTQAIYCKDTLIWSKKYGIPERGVLEVDEE